MTKTSKPLLGSDRGRVEYKRKVEGRKRQKRQVRRQTIKELHSRAKKRKARLAKNKGSTIRSNTKPSRYLEAWTTLSSKRKEAQWVLLYFLLVRYSSAFQYYGHSSILVWHQQSNQELNGHLLLRTCFHLADKLLRRDHFDNELSGCRIDTALRGNRRIACTGEGFRERYTMIFRSLQGKIPPAPIALGERSNLHSFLVSAFSLGKEDMILFEECNPRIPALLCKSTSEDLRVTIVF